MEYRVLGPVSASTGGEAVVLGGPRQRLALALLLADPGCQLSVDKLVEGIWGGSPPPRSRHTLQAYVSELRRVLDDRIVWTGSGYLLEADLDQIDARRFERLGSEARSALEESPGRAASLREALELWHGEPYADLAHADALQPEIRRLNQLRLVAVEDRLEADLALGRHRSVVEELEALTREHPFRERLHAHYMLALYRSGRQAEALRAYQAARIELAEELGIDPSPELRELEQRILDQDASLAPPSAPVLRGSSPVEPPKEPPLAVRGFELRGLVGEGRLGRVFRAYQPAMGREVALKIVRPALANDAEFIRWFEAEARAVTGLEHPHAVPVCDYWRHPDVTCLVMPWMAGGSLADVLERGPLSLPSLMRLVDQIGGALSYAHGHGVLHRNITPSNVLFDLDGNAYLTDFRMAVVERSTPVSPHAAPEEKLGLPVTHLADVFQFGMLIRHGLGGVGHVAAKGLVARGGAILPNELHPVISRATAADPADRFRTIDELVRELRRATGSDVVGLPTLPGDQPGSGRNPYKGLRAFQETDASDFFGREDLIGTLVEEVADRRLVAVVGPSGSGKSSLVRAGLIPAIRSGAVDGSETWLISDMFPGTHPFDELVTALDRVALTPTKGLLDELTNDEGGLLRVVKQILPDPDSELLLVIDQFEELFSMVTDLEVRRFFLDALAAATTDPASRMRVVLTLRADFFDFPLQYHRFGELVRSGLVTVPAVAPDGLARAVSRPARNVGLELEPGLAVEIVGDVEGQPGSLPLFQHVLAELFDHRSGRVLTIDSYRQSGGVAAALGRRAEELYQSLTRVEQETARDILLRLVTVDETSEDTRRRVRRSELTALGAGIATIASVLQRFGAHRLLTFDNDPVTRGATVEVAHEALLHEWDRLRDWIEARRGDLLLHRRLEAALREWTDADRSEAFLLSGGRLDLAEQWAAGTNLTLTSLERDFLASSRAREDALHARRRRNRRRVVAGLAGFAVLAAVLAVVATLQQRRAEVGERAARVRELTAAAGTNLDQDPDLALLLAMEAMDLAADGPDDVTWAATASLHEALLATPKVVAVDGGEEVAWSPDGGRVVTLGRGHGDQNAYVWDSDTGEELASLPGRHSPNRLAWRGDRIVITYLEAPAIIWDAESYEPLGTVGNHLHGYTFALMTPDGVKVTLSEISPGGGRPTAVTVWEIETGAELLRLDFPAGSWAPAISPDGTQLAVPETETGLVRVFDLTSGEETLRLDHGGHVDWVAYSPDGLRMATAGNVMKLWDLSNGPTSTELSSPGSATLGPLTWDPSGSRLAGAGSDAAYVLEIGSEVDPVALRGHAQLEAVAFSPDGGRIATAGENSRIWDLSALSGGQLATYQDGVGHPVTHTAWTSDGSKVVSTSFDTGATTVFNASTGRALGDFPNQAAWGINARGLPSPDGRYLALTGITRDDEENPIGTTIVLDAATLEEVAVLDPGGNPGAFSADSSLLMVGNFRVAHVYEVGSWTLLATLSDPASRTDGFYAFWDGHFLDDGRHLVTGDSGLRPGAAVWNMRDWSIIATLPVGDGSPAYSISGGSEGGLVALGSSESGIVSIYDEDAILDALPEPATPLLEVDVSEPPIFVSLSPDESILATGGFDEHLTLWEVSSGERIYSIDMGMIVSEAAFTPDGRHVLVALDQGVTQLLTMDPEELIELGRQRAVRGFTEEECRRYLHLGACPTG